MVKQQQQLGKRNTYTPLSASQAQCSVVLSLNREETLGEQDLKTYPNNLDVNLRSGKTEQNLRVSVLNMRGKPLMPTTPCKARKLLRENKAKVISCKPFTLQLLIATGETKQEIVLGIDTGHKNIGYSATTKTKELICGEVILRTDISEKITDRSMYRRNKRNKLWYRQPKFLNRTRSKKKGWLAPSVQHKIDSHLRLIDKIKTILPISKITIESTQFDAQKLQNPDINGVEYQQGQMLGFENVKMFVRQRDNYTCQICKKKNFKDDGVLEVHHIIQRKDGGSDRPDNLVTLHQKCHKNFHLGKIKHTFTNPKSYKETSMMNSLWSRLRNRVACDETFGYITKFNRQKLGLEKTHYNDAFVISGGSNQKRCKPKISKPPRRNNRKLQVNRKGFKPSIRRQRYKIQPNDVVKYNNVKYNVKGMFNYGKYVRLVNIFGKILDLNIKKIGLIYHGKGIQI